MASGTNRSRQRNRNVDSLQVQRERANKRERERTKSLNSAYIHLRQKIPSLPSDKTSKIHTLRVTIDYINFLYELVYNQSSILSHMDLTIQEDSQINLPATFNSWRTSLNQKWHTNFLKHQQAQKRNQQIQQEIQESALPESKDPYCPNGFPAFANPNFTTKSDTRNVRSKRVKAENSDLMFGPNGYTLNDYVNFSVNADPSSSLGCALGHAIASSTIGK